MILSMTGYGRATAEYGGVQYTVEIKCLNSKTIDIRTKMPAGFMERELPLRKMVTDGIIRGRVEVNVISDSPSANGEVSLDQEMMGKYIKQLQQVKDTHQLDDADIISAVMRIPNVLVAETHFVSDEEWDVIATAVSEAIAKVNKFRQDEGVSLKEDMVNRVKIINQSIDEITPHEQERIPRIKDRMRKHLEDYKNNDKLDQNRFEQEVLFYLEKIDINEEKVRLGQHCIYFMEELEKQSDQKGKKLNFIAQEMGREINTLGAKAQDSNMQKIVVRMKDELEKVKEQLANTL